MTDKNIITLKSTWKEILDVLNEVDKRGNRLADDESLSGNIAVMNALLDEDVCSFDGEPIYNTILIGIKMN
jgi:hypothetical protein